MLSKRSWRLNLLAVLLLGLYALLRMAYPAAFPLFIDEAHHIQWSGDLVTRTPLIMTGEGRQFTLYYLWVFRSWDIAPITIARTAGVLVGMVGFAALLASARLLVGMTGMLLAGSLYLFSRYHFFYDRLILGDSLAAAAILVAVYFSLRLLRRYALMDALITGVVLFIATGFKLSILPYYGIPLAAALFVPNPALRFTDRLRWAGVALATAAGLLGIYAGIVRVFGYDLFYLFGVHNPGESDLMTRLLTNSQFAWQVLSDYFSPVGWVALLGCMSIAIVKRRLAIPLMILAPLLVLLLNGRQSGRYWIPSVSLLVLCAGAVIPWLMQSIIPHRQRLQYAIIGAVVLGAAAYWLPFGYAAYTHPLRLSLPAPEYREYIVADASGAGLATVRDILQSQQPDRVLGLLANCYGLRYTAPELAIECPVINPDGSDRDPLAQLLQANRAAGVYVVLEDSPYVPATAPGRIIATVTRPGGRANLTIYHLISPLAQDL